MPQGPQQSGIGQQTGMSQTDVQSMIVNAIACHCLLQQETSELVLSHDQLKTLIETYTIRLELMNPRQPELSDVKVSVITVEEAKKFMSAMQKKKK